MGVSESQALLGAGMGAGVGMMQARAIRGVVSDPRAWVFSSAVGLAAPFLAFDLSRAAGFPLPYSLYVCVALGGLVAGLGQSIFLRRAARRAWLWVPGSALGWSLAAATAAIANVLPRALSLRGLAGAGIYLTIVLGGGLILGSVTGLLLVRLDWRKTGSGTGGAASTGRK